MDWIDFVRLGSTSKKMAAGEKKKQKNLKVQKNTAKKPLDTNERDWKTTDDKAEQYNGCNYRSLHILRHLGGTAFD